MHLRNKQKGERGGGEAAAVDLEGELGCGLLAPGMLRCEDPLLRLLQRRLGLR